MDYDNVKLFFLTGLPRSGTTWMKRMLDSHPEVSCKGEARIITSPFEKGAGLWDFVESGIIQWVSKEGSRKGNGFCEPEHEEIAWRNGSNPVVLSSFVDRNARNLSDVSMASLVRYLLLGNATEETKACGEKTPLTKPDDVYRFNRLRGVGLDITVISMVRKTFSEWLKSYHKHNLYRWETSYATSDFYPFTKDDYIKTVRAVRDHDKAVGEMISFPQIERAFTRYSNVNLQLKLVSNMTVLYEDLVENTEKVLGKVFGLLGVNDSAEPERIAKEERDNHGKSAEADASDQTVEEYFRDGNILERLKEIDREAEYGWQ